MMTDTQIRFLKAIYKRDMTAKELCKKLRIKPYENDSIGGYYNTLNASIKYLELDDGNEIDNMFIIHADSSPVSNNDIYSISKEGRQYIETFQRDRKNKNKEIHISILGIFVAIVIAIAQMLNR